MITLKTYLNTNKKYYRKNYVTLKRLGEYNNIQEFINKHMTHILGCTLDFKGTARQIKKQITNTIKNELKGLN